MSLIEPQPSDQRGDFVRLRVGMGSSSDSIERDEGKSSRAFGVHDLDQSRSSTICIDDDMEETGNHNDDQRRSSEIR
jgi:hypothetical protein